MKIRKATQTDMPFVLNLIRELAAFEREPEAVVVTVDDLIRDGFSQPPLFQAEENVGYSNHDPEEVERQKLRDQENKAFMNKLCAKQEKERVQIHANKARAKEELNKWYQDRVKDMQRKKELNLQQEELRKENLKKYENPWKKVATMIEFKEAIDRKELARMRAVLIAKKHEG